MLDWLVRRIRRRIMAIDRQEMESDSDRRARVIRELCQLGGVTEMAEAFIASRTETPETVRRSLVTCARLPLC